METDPDINEKEYCLITESKEEIDIKGLPCMLIYGPNGSGKSNLIQAIALLRDIILNHLLRAEMNAVELAQLLKPITVFQQETENIELDIGFINKGTLYDYSLNLEIVPNKDRFKLKVSKEHLSVNESTVFERWGNRLVYFNQKFLKSYISLELIPPELINEDLRDDQLFINVGSYLIENDICENFFDWFINKLFIVFDTSTINNLITNPVLENYQRIEMKPSFKKEVNSILKALNINDIDSRTLSEKFFEKVSNTDLNLLISDGERILKKLIPLILHALKTGTTLIIDNIDSSINSTIIMNFISIFNDDEINKNHAQLIFTTHNPSYLTPKLVRRDEVVFLSPYNEGTELYSLSDYDIKNTREDYLDIYYDNQDRLVDFYNGQEIVSKILNNL